MTKNNGFKVAALAASIALAMGATSAMAADPAATQLPGVGTAAAGTVTPGAIAAGVQTIDVGTASAVINWGKAGGTINASGADAQPAGFNIGSAAELKFSNGTGAAAAVLNIDSTGNASQILGKLDDASAVNAVSIFVANANGIIVGDSAQVTSQADVGLIANTLIGTNGGFAGGYSSLAFGGTGGDVTVPTGATLTAGGNVYVAGGGNVNVDVATIAATGTGSTVTAGVSHLAVPAAPNASAALTITSGVAVSDIAFSSAGTASNTGTTDLSGQTVSVSAKGGFTNSGDLTLDPTSNTITGAVNNVGQLDTTAGAATFDSLTNAGQYDADGVTISGGGNLVNTGTITGAGAVTVTNGYISNSGSIAGVTSMQTQSTDASNSGYTAGGQYYISNNGTITSTGDLTINANNSANHAGTAANNSTGSFTNAGTLQLGANPLVAAAALDIRANNNITLGGSLSQNTNTSALPAPAVYKAVSKTNYLGAVTLMAADSSASTPTGTLTVSAPLFGAGTWLQGAQVKVMSNVTSSGTVDIRGGAAQTNDYAIRIAAGTTTTGTAVNVNGSSTTSADLPNTILQGTLSAGTITFGDTTVGGLGPVGDIISGPAGGLVVSGGTPKAIFNFAGRLKTAPYLNNANNFRYNYLPISLATGATAPVQLTLNPMKYQTNGTSNGLSGVNLLVNGDVTLTTMTTPTAASQPSAVTGVTNWPNTHVVLQSTGNIATAGAAYWPGYVYLGTVNSDSNGNALPGTLSSAGKITLGGNFSNVLPGDVAGASGIHFMSGNALVGGGFNVATNANALINFPTDLLTQSYATGLLTNPTFTGGTASGLVVTYGTLGAAFFNTHPVDSSK